MGNFRELLEAKNDRYKISPDDWNQRKWQDWLQKNTTWQKGDSVELKLYFNKAGKPIFVYNYMKNLLTILQKGLNISQLYMYGLGVSKLAKSKRIFRNESRTRWSTDREAIQIGHSFGDLIGLFETKENIKYGRAALYHLFEIQDYEKKNLKEKPGEKICRYVTITSAVGGYAPLIKVNADKGLVYFLKDYEADDEDLEFKTKATVLEYLRVTW